MVILWQSIPELGIIIILSTIAKNYLELAKSIDGKNYQGIGITKKGITPNNWVLPLYFLNFSRGIVEILEIGLPNVELYNTGREKLMENPHTQL